MRTFARALTLIFIFVIPWEGVVRLPEIGTGAKILGIMVAAVWIVTVVITGQLRKPGPFHIAVYLFFLWNAFSIFWSSNVSRSVAHVVTWAQLLVMIFVLWDLYTTRSAIMAGLQAYILGAYVAIGSAVANYLAGNAFYTYYQRFTPGDTNPDGFGFILALGIPVAWYLAGSTSSNKMGTLLKVVNYAYIPAVFLGIALSGTRTALIIAIPGMAFGLASLTKLRLSARIGILLLLVLMIILLLPSVQPLRSFQRFGTIGAEITEGDLNNRTNNWLEGLTAFEEHPLLGVGSNMYRSMNSLGKLAHNTFLSVLVEIGLIGFTLFGIILTITIIQAWGLPKWEKRFWLTMLAIWAIGATTLTWEHRKTTWLFMGLLIATAAIKNQFGKSEPIVRLDQREAPVMHFSKHSKLPSGE